MPIDISPASYIPGVSLARGSLASEPVIPAGAAAPAQAQTDSLCFLLVGFAFAGFDDS